MDDLISRQAAIAHTISGRTRELDGEKWIRVSEVRESLQIMPSAEKKGKWIKHEVKLFDGCHTGRYFEECSECGKLTPEWRIVTEYHYWNFCPRCGADMHKGEEKEINDAIH